MKTQHQNPELAHKLGDIRKENLKKKMKCISILRAVKFRKPSILVIN
jgi:hypothetical protein